MTIQCPNCGFLGRAPGYIASTLHLARCPKCQHRFEVGGLPAPYADPVDDVDYRAAPRRESATTRLDPGASSYELKALSADFGEDGEGAASFDDWDSEDDAPPGWWTATVARVAFLRFWAVALTAWALLIGVRAVASTLRSSDEALFSPLLLWPASTVVLLVFASGALLTIDSGRVPRWPMSSPELRMSPRPRARIRDSVVLASDRDDFDS